ncbi:MAG: hypothetical protein F6K13_20290 [Okeania sp. SIO2B9]|nr:hypothetical protein [Okeania sp. SIO2B9]
MAFAIAMRSMIAPGQTFEKLWQVIQCEHSFWYVTDGDRVYPKYIQPEDQMVLQNLYDPRVTEKTLP